MLTSSERCDFALLVEGVGEAFRSAQHLLVSGWEAFLEKFQRAIMGGCDSGGEPHPAV